MRRLMIFALALLASTVLSASLTACRQVPQGGSPSLRVSPSSSPTPALSEAEGPTNNPKPTEPPTPTATPTPTEVPLPSELKNLPQGITAVHNEDGSWGIGTGTGNEITPIPNAVFDSTGLHMTLDSGRIVNIPVSELQKGIVYDQESNLLKIYDDQGIISAEYDPGVGQPDSLDYIPGQGWVDIQKLAGKACDRTSKCFIENARGLPSGTTSVNFASTGIFRKIDALDTQTNNPVGEFLLLQLVTRNTTDKPVVSWMIVQASDTQGVNVFAGDSQMMQALHGLPMDKTLHPIEQWQSWMPKSSLWEFGFLKNGDDKWWFWTQNHLAPADYQNKITQFFASKGDVPLDGVYPLINNSGSSR